MEDVRTVIANGIEKLLIDVTEHRGKPVGTFDLMTAMGGSIAKILTSAELKKACEIGKVELEERQMAMIGFLVYCTVTGLNMVRNEAIRSKPLTEPKNARTA